MKCGADDYITKPFSPIELKTRIQVILRRGPILKLKEIIQSGPIEINTATHDVVIHRKRLSLPPIEYKLLVHFITYKNRVFSRTQLLTYVWGEEQYLDERTVDVQIKRLRKRLLAVGCDEVIQTVRGFGYQYNERVYEKD